LKDVLVYYNIYQWCVDVSFKAKLYVYMLLTYLYLVE